MAGFNQRTHLVSLALGCALVGFACEPPRPHRIPVPPPSNPVLRTPPPAPPAPAPPSSIETARKPLPQQGKIREQDLQDTPAAALPQETKEFPPLPPYAESRPELKPTPLPDDSSLLAKITPGVTPQRAASLRLTEEGKKLIDAGEPAKALSRLEKTIVIDSTNPYGYIYIAKAQYRLGRYKESLNFLDIAESRLGNEAFWLAEIHALRGENYRGLGQFQRAEASYQQAIRLNSGNQTAADGLSRLQNASAPVGK